MCFRLVFNGWCVLIVAYLRYSKSFDGRTSLQVNGHSRGHPKEEVVPLVLLLHSIAMLLFHLILPPDVDIVQSNRRTHIKWSPSSHFILLRYKWRGTIRPAPYLR